MNKNSSLLVSAATILLIFVASIFSSGENAIVSLTAITLVALISIIVTYVHQTADQVSPVEDPETETVPGTV